MTTLMSSPLRLHPIRRSTIPPDLASVITVGVETDPGDVGLTRGAVDDLWASVVSLYRSGLYPAMQLCIRRDGHVVLDRAIGHTRGNGPDDPPDAEKVLATPQTPFCVFSASKAITATVIHLLAEHAKLNLLDPVATYIPEFTGHGKDRITIAHVLSHRAGIQHLPREVVNDYLAGEDAAALAYLYGATPTWPAGQRQAYHALSGGAVLGEVVRRVTGESIREVLTAEILQPLGFRWTNYGVPARDVSAVARNYPTQRQSSPLKNTYDVHVLGVAADTITEASNEPRFLGAVIPSANVVTTANELTRFYELLRCGGALDGIRVFEPAMLRRALSQRSHHDFDRSLLLPVSMSLGFMVGDDRFSAYGADTAEVFGHDGFSVIKVWADPRRAISVALISSGKTTSFREVARITAFTAAVAKIIPKVASRPAASDHE